MNNRTAPRSGSGSVGAPPARRGAPVADTTGHRQLSGWVLVAGQFALLAVLVLAPAATLWPLPDAVRTAGLVGRAFGAGAILLGAAWLGLGASVHPAPTTHATLRTTGPYRYVRHPIYTGVLVLGAALAIAGRSLLHIAALAALVALLNVKARFEERLLVERFSGYPTYRERTGRFLPQPTPWRGRRMRTLPSRRG